MAEGLVKRSLRIAGHRTSVALEPEFWAALDAIAADRGVTTSRLVATIDGTRQGTLASALRLHVLAALQAASAAVPCTGLALEARNRPT